MYWWVVWLYGIICAGFTCLEGNEVTIGTQELLLYPRSWMGVSMILLILFVVIFTNVKARGVYSITLVLGVGLVCCACSIDIRLGSNCRLFSSVESPREPSIFCNAVSDIMFCWFVTIFGFDPLTYWYCWECGRALSPERRTFCSDECAHTYRQAMGKRRPVVEPVARPSRKQHQEATLASQRAAPKAQTPDYKALRLWYAENFQPRLSRMHPTEIALGAAIGRSYAY
jgi:hypothetical protein